MNKLKNVFQRSQKLKSEERRPQQFVNKIHSNIKIPLEVESPSIPSIDTSALSEMERPVYESWWKDLDPFDFKQINNQTIIKFLTGCTLEDNKLEQILTLFDSARDGLDKYQFFAMLRLIAHAQNGRRISRALIYLGAPIPYFKTNPIDAIIQPPIQKIPIHPDRKSWWGFEKHQPTDTRRSYIGPFTDHTPIPSNYDAPLIDYYYSPLKPSISTQPTVSTQTTTHTRSRSAGNVSDLMTLQDGLQSSRSSLSLNELNTGQSLLLTQKFVYQSPSVRHQELQNQTNPFHRLDETSPFEDLVDLNSKPNRHLVYPPPVPSQATKPSFLKYTRNPL